MDNKPAGQNWLLLRGLAREPAHWGDFIGVLQAAFPDAAINTVALPGTGEFYQQDSPDNIGGISEFVRQQALARGLLEKPVTILALSLGAMVTWEWLRRYPDDCAAAALISTSFAGLSPFYQRLRWQGYGQLVSVLRERDVFQKELKTLQLVNNSRERDAALAQQWAQIHQQRPISAKTAYRQIRAASAYRPQAERPDTPILLINSQGDHLVSPKCSEAIAKKWQLELRTHPWAGHDLTVDDGAWVAAQLQDWLAGRAK
ncbi:alpha/beta hydrolase [Methylosoma difficile]